MDSNVDSFLEWTISQFKSLKTNDFSGIGIVIYNDLQRLPYSELTPDAGKRFSLPISDPERILRIFQEISSVKSPYHDGFHLISSGLTLTNLCCYFAPPIVVGLGFQGIHGARFRSAQYGSVLPAVDRVAIIGKEYQSYIFKKPYNGEKRIH